MREFSRILRNLTPEFLIFTWSKKIFPRKKNKTFTPKTNHPAPIRNTFHLNKPKNFLSVTKNQKKNRNHFFFFVENSPEMYLRYKGTDPMCFHDIIIAKYRFLKVICPAS